MKVKKTGKSGGATRRGYGLVPGQLVRGRVIARLGTGLFRVGASGYIFNAQSDLPLRTGQRLAARVELGDSRICLRILDDYKRQSTSVYEEESPEEIRRVLEGLGQKPDDLEVIEFSERLSRYKQVVGLPDGEPSLVWVLAILWVRGIKGGADAFALNGFYLRYTASQARRTLPQIPPEDILRMWNDDPPCDPPDTLSDPAPPSIPEINDSFVEDRKLEVLALLNRHAEIHGRFHHVPRSRDTACALSSHQPDGYPARWADNPALPRILIEAAIAQGRIKTRLHFLTQPNDDMEAQRSEWVHHWQSALQDSGLEIETCQTCLKTDPESLRFLLWRKWDQDAFIREFA